MRETGFEVPCPWVKDRTASLAWHRESRTETQGKLPQLCKARCDGLLGDQRTQSHPPVSPVCCHSAVRSQSCELLWSGAGEQRGRRGKIKEGGWQLASRRWGKVPLAAAPPALRKQVGVQRARRDCKPRGRSDTAPAAVSLPCSQTARFPSAFPRLRLNSLAPLLCFLARKQGEAQMQTCSVMKIPRKAVSYPNKALQPELPPGSLHLPAVHLNEATKPPDPWGI